MFLNVRKEILVLGVSMIFVSCVGKPTRTDTTVTNIQRTPTRLYASQVDSVAIQNIKSSGICPQVQVFEKESSYKKLMGYANVCISKGQWNVVEQIGERMHAVDADMPWGAYYMSVASENRGHIERAQWMINLALKKANKVGLLKYQLGRILWQKKLYKDALSEIESALSLDPKIKDAYVFLGQVYLRELNFDKSEKFFEKATELDSRNYSVIFGLASCYVEKEKTQDALSLLQRGISSYPRDLPLRLQEVYVYENLLKQLETALSKYKEIQNLMAKNKIDGSVPFDLKDKIKNLEDSLSKRKLASK